MLRLRDVYWSPTTEQDLLKLPYSNYAPKIVKHRNILQHPPYPVITQNVNRTIDDYKKFQFDLSLENFILMFVCLSISEYYR